MSTKQRGVEKHYEQTESPSNDSRLPDLSLKMWFLIGLVTTIIAIVVWWRFRNNSSGSGGNSNNDDSGDGSDGGIRSTEEDEEDGDVLEIEIDDELNEDSVDQDPLEEDRKIMAELKSEDIVREFEPDLA